MGQLDFSKILYPYQKKFVLDNAKIVMWLKARQIGGSFGIAFKCVYRAMTVGKHQIIISTNQRNAARLIEECKKIITLFGTSMGKPIDLKQDNLLEIGFTNGAKIISLPNNPDTAIGYSGDLYIDEAARFRNDKEILEAIMPFASRGHNITICSTPLGTKGFFYDYCQKAMAGKRGFSLYNIDVYEAIKQGAPIDISIIKNEMDEDSFARNYLCKFLDTSNEYFSYELLQSCIDSSLENYDFEKLKRTNNLVAGIDLAKSRDSTVLTIVEKNNSGANRVVYVEEFKKTDYVDQVDAISHIIKISGIGKVYIDSTGVGSAVVELFQRVLGSIVEPVMFTNNSKEFMISNLKLLFERKQLAIPDIQKLFDQLIHLNRSLTRTNLVSFAHEKGDHDDYVWSLALACYGIKVDKVSYNFSKAIIPVRRRVKLIF